MSVNGPRVGIMQPYFFPYLGHFSLIANVDRWIVFDLAQYTPKSWMNRNRVLHPSNGWMYVTAPVQGSSRSKRINEVVLHTANDALRSLIGSLAHYKRKARFYDEVLALVCTAFSTRQGDTLVDIDTAALVAVADYLGLRFEYDICSELGLDLENVAHPGEWALRIARGVGAREYLNPLGGSHLFRADDFQAAGIALRFLDMPPFRYDPAPYQYVPNLSVLDVLMWNNPSEIRNFVLEQSIVVTAGDSSQCFLTNQ